NETAWMGCSWHRGESHRKHYLRPVKSPKLLRLLSALALLVCCSPGALTHAATKVEEQAQPLGEKGKLIFADDFSSDRFGTVWSEHIATAGVENGVMFGRQTGAAHGAVALTKLDLPDGNLICECRVQWE